MEGPSSSLAYHPDPIRAEGQLGADLQGQMLTHAKCREQDCELNKETLLSTPMHLPTANDNTFFAKANSLSFILNSDAMKWYTNELIIVKFTSFKQN